MNETIAIILLLISALGAALYNSFIKISTDRLILFTGMNIAFVLIGIIFLCFVPVPPPEAFYYLIGSSIAYCGSTFFICRSYAKADLGLAFPVISGSRAIFTALLSVTILHENASWYEWLAIAGIISGIFIQFHMREFWNKAHSNGILIAILAGLFSGLQFIFDVQGIRHCENPFSYIAYAMLLGTPIIFIGLWKHKKAIINLLKTQYKLIAAGALLDIIMYICVMLVVYKLKVLYVMPITSLSIVFSALIGLFILKEKYGPRRITAAFIIMISVIVTQL